MLSQRGSALTMVLVASAVTMIAMGGTAVWLNHGLKQQHNVELAAMANTLQSRIRSYIESQESWRRTLTGDSQFECMLVDGTDCSTAGGTCVTSTPDGSCGGDGTISGGYVDLRDPAGEIYVRKPSGSIYQQGFDINGKPCAEFTMSGNDICPFRYEIQWHPRCSGSCPSTLPTGALFATNIELEMRATLLFKPSSGAYGELNVAKYSFTHVRNQSGILATQCASMGGTFNATLQSCDLPMISGSPCPAHTFVIGVDASRNRVCQTTKMIDNRCMNGSAIVGIDDAGRFICGKF